MLANYRANLIFAKWVENAKHTEFFPKQFIYNFKQCFPLRNEDFLVIKPKIDEREDPTLLLLSLMRKEINNKWVWDG